MFYINSSNSLLRNVLKLLSGTTLANIVTFVFSVVLARIYSPTEFGVYTLFLTIGVSIGSFATGRYEMTIILPKKREEAKLLAYLCIIITVLFSIVCFFILYVLRVIELIKLDLFLLLPLFVLFTGIYQTFYYYFNRNDRYGKMGISKLIQAVLTALFSIILDSHSYYGLVIAHIAGLILSVVYLMWFEKREIINNILSKDRPSIRQVIYLARKYKEMPLYNSIHVLNDIAMNNGVIFIISWSYGTAILGLYSFAWKTLRAPLSMIGTAIGQVYINASSKLYQDRRAISPLVNKIIMRLTIIAIPIFGVLMIFSENIFGLAFGDKWVEAGNYTQLLIPWLFFNFIGSPIVQTFVVLKKQKVAVYYASIQTILMLVTTLILAFLKVKIETFLIYLSITGALTTVGFILWIYFILRQYEKSIYEKHNTLVNM
ncbi:lipopolysaccharide biosynthesis protein [Priestia megaterium]|uniref:lipopolysaccharide biosynthesis protein n=1 Tax=Priestia megaterium TaxID=1404 RepID=UPI00366ED1BB